MLRKRSNAILLVLKNNVLISKILICLHLVGQGHHDSERCVFSLINTCIDDISGEKVDEEEGSKANGEMDGQSPLWEQLQREVLQLSGSRQRPSIQNSESQLGGNLCHCLLSLRTASTQVHLEHEKVLTTQKISCVKSLHSFVNLIFIHLCMCTHNDERMCLAPEK